jgi:hypothetical protein
MAEKAYTVSYSDFLGVDMSSDARSVSRNRLAYSVNMWRDYESEQGGAIETFPGFRRVAESLGLDSDGGTPSKIHGFYNFRSRKGIDYVIVHAGTRLYSFEEGKLAAGNYREIESRSAILSGELADSNSTGFIYNNNFYILDGVKFWTVTDTEDGASIKASQVDAYIPTTYYNGKVYEQRNMISKNVYQIDTDSKSDLGHVKLKPSDEDDPMVFIRYRVIDVVYEASEDVAAVWYGGIKYKRDYNNYVPGMENDYFILGDFVDYNKFFTDTINDKNGIFTVEYKDVELGGESKRVVSKVYIYSANEELLRDAKEFKIELVTYGTHFNTIEGINSFVDGNTSYKKTTVDAINGCTKAALYDGRVFLTGNPELPNTVFYSHRNLTGANDPTYFGIYNYFNDGEGNTPNVDLLSTPSMLMVLKRDTIQDGSIYYHVGMYNENEGQADLLPRIYPSTQGAAGLGSVAKAVPGHQSCNFFDDPVFLSRRGLEAIGKETVNLERTVQHRSSQIDRALIREELSEASMTEWKRYLVICVNGHMYLADSRYLFQHPDGSYQYEWFYLEGLGTYEHYAPRWGSWLKEWPMTYREGYDDVLLDEYLTLDGIRVGDGFSLMKNGDIASNDTVMVCPIIHPYDSDYIIDLYYIERDGVKYVVEIHADEKIGVGNFYPANKILTVGERLYFTTDHGDVCVINTDMRGVPVDDREPDADRIDRAYYTFNGVRYFSGCATRLDDCGQKTSSKATISGTTVGRFKMMPGSYCAVKVSTNGRDFVPLGEAFNSRFDFADFQFSNFSFAENENNIVVFPEILRRWVEKQYFFYSDAYQAPFGLYELSYNYKIVGKIRY